MADNLPPYVAKDRQEEIFYNQVLQDNIERVAFIRLVTSKRASKLRSGYGRINLWISSRSSRINTATAQNNVGTLPVAVHPIGAVAGSQALQRPVVAVAPPPPPPPPPSFVPAFTIVDVPPEDGPPHTGTALALGNQTVATGQTDTQLNAAETNVPDDAVVADGGNQEDVDRANIGEDQEQSDRANTEEQTAHLADKTTPSSHYPKGKKRSQQDENATDVNPRTTKRRCISIGGGSSPPFIYHNDPTMVLYMVPTRTQRVHIDNFLEGEKWHFATILKQVSLAAIPEAYRYGMPPKSLYLFVRVDERGVVRDQKVVKAFDSLFDDIWAAKDQAYENTFVREDSIRKALSAADSSAKNCPHLVQYHGASEQQQSFMIGNARKLEMAKTVVHRGNVGSEALPNAEADSDVLGDRRNWDLRYIYSEYASHQTLRQLIDAHQREQEPIPEHFILYVLTRLLSALTALEAGRILHLGIEPEHIFFGTPDLAYPAYRKVMLGSFKSAVQMNNDATSHPNLEARPSNALAWPPPELAHRDLIPASYSPRKWTLTQTTDLFSLGLVIREMMICSTTSREELTQLKDHEAAAYLQGQNPMLVTDLKCPDWYSVGLVDMVRGCLKFSQDERRTLDELKRRAHSDLEVLDDLLGPQVFDAHFDDRHPLWVQFPKEDVRFAIGTVFEPVDVTEPVRGTLAQHSAGYARCSADYAVFKAVNLPVASRVDQERALEQIYKIGQEDYLRADADGILQVEKDLSLKHLRSTILGFLNSEGQFHQAQGTQEPAFFSVRRKIETLDFGARSAKALARAEGMEEDVDTGLRDGLLVIGSAFTFGAYMLRLGAGHDEGTPQIRTTTESHRGVWEYVLSKPAPITMMRPSIPTEAEEDADGALAAQ